jgi:hypothetical protein
MHFLPMVSLVDDLTQYPTWPCLAYLVLSSLFCIYTSEHTIQARACTNREEAPYTATSNSEVGLPQS